MFLRLWILIFAWTNQEYIEFYRLSLTKKYLPIKLEMPMVYGIAYLSGYFELESSAIF